MGWIIWGVVLPSCLVAAWLIVRNPLRQVLEEMRVDQARLRFRQQREWLEADSSGPGKADPIERLRWEDAHWHERSSGPATARPAACSPWSRSTSTPIPFDDDAPHATALFEYRKGRWFADGKRLDATRPDEAFRRLAASSPSPSQPRPDPANIADLHDGLYAGRVADYSRFARNRDVRPGPARESPASTRRSTRHCRPRGPGASPPLQIDFPGR